MSLESCDSNSPVWTGILPVIAELTKAHLNAKPDDSSCTRSCVPELPSMLLTLEREIDRHVQYVNYLQEKMNALPTTTNLSMVTSKSRLMLQSFYTIVATKTWLTVLES
jgi:hypothetical protein